jgi:hypothetical protein
MADYVYLYYEQQSLVDRFPQPGVYGIDLWRRYTTFLIRLLGERDNAVFEAELRTIVLRELEEGAGPGPSGTGGTGETRPTDELVLVLLQSLLRRSVNTIPATRCPCVFISHRQPDTLYALRIAQLAARNGFDYWVDILDPALKLLTANPMIPQCLVPLLTACIIEMALINCTHVLACMTPQSRGSLWMPYEYGRITEIPGLYRRSCAWQHPLLAVADYPEYMYLGVTARTEPEIEAWLQAERPIGGGWGCGEDRHGVEVMTELEKLTEEENQQFEAWLAAGMPLTEDVTLLPVIKLKPR